VEAPEALIEIDDVMTRPPSRAKPGAVTAQKGWAVPTSSSVWVVVVAQNECSR
jgi:hypothetical protein